MKVIFFILLLITFNLRNYSQTKEKSDIFTFSASEDKFLRIDRIKQFQRENPFNLNAIEFICDYYKYKKVDSISIFFDDLAKKYPDSVKPWILRTEKLFYEIDYRNDSLYQSKKLEYLKKAYAINRNSFDVNYKLAKLFYDDFIDPYEKIFIKETKVIDREKNDSSYTQIDTLKMKDKSIFNHPEDSALFYFHNLENLSEQYKHFLYFPIKQIDTYKNISSDQKLDSLMGISNNCYFPFWYFVNLPEKWEYKLTINYLSQIEASYEYIEYIKSRLEILKEPCLYRLIVPMRTEIYRLTWLRTFHNPISIRVEKRGDNIQLYCKIANGNGLGGVDRLIKSIKRPLSNSEWNSFIELLNKAEFDKLPKRISATMLDGATWTLEKKTASKFKVFETNVPKGFFKDACLYLIRLSKIKIEENEIY